MKKGFTLVELLAIIIILGIIALIAIPIVSSLIDKADKKTFDESVKNLVRAIEYKCQDEKLSGSDPTTVYTFTEDGVTPKIEVEGKLPIEGTISVNYKCETIVDVSDGKYIVSDLPEPMDASCFDYEEVDGEIAITGYNCGNSGTKNRHSSIDFGDSGTEIDVVVPSTINRKKVTRIESFAFSPLNGTSIDTFDKNKTIGINSIVIPDSVTYIGEYAFLRNQLTSVTIGSSLTTGDSVTSIGEGAFSYNQLTSVIIGNGVETIGANAFSLNKLTSVTIGNGVKTVGNNAFHGNQLTNVVIGNSVETIGENVFVGNRITSLIIPDSVISVGAGAFEENEIASLTLGNSLTNVGIGAFAWNQYTSLIIPDSLTTIGDSAFEGNDLTSIIIPNTVTTIASGAFANNQLTSVIIPDSVTTIGASAFYDNQLTSVTIGSSVETIGDSAFKIDNWSIQSFWTNPNLRTINNLTGRSFNWTNIINQGGSNYCIFVTGTCGQVTIKGGTN